MYLCSIFGISSVILVRVIKIHLKIVKGLQSHCNISKCCSFRCFFVFVCFFSLALCLWATLLEFQKLTTNYSVCCKLVCWSPALQRSDWACARHCVLLCQICTGFRVCYEELSRISDSSPKEMVLLDAHLSRCSARLCQMYCRRIYFTFGPSVQAPITAVGSRWSGCSSRVYLFLLLLNVQYAHDRGSSGCTSVTQCIILKWRWV